MDNLVRSATQAIMRGNEQQALKTIDHPDFSHVLFIRENAKRLGESAVRMEMAVNGFLADPYILAVFITLAPKYNLLPPPDSVLFPLWEEREVV